MESVSTSNSSKNDNNDTEEPITPRDGLRSETDSKKELIKENSNIIIKEKTCDSSKNTNFNNRAEVTEITNNSPNTICNTEKNISKIEISDPSAVITQQPFSSSENFPMILAYPTQNRPRQPFMNQPTSQQQQQQQQQQQPARVPAPPIYYSNEVTEDQHQPEQLRRFSSSRVRNVQIQQPPPRVHYQNLPNYQPGQLAIMPNTLLNIAYWAPYPSHIPSNIPACLAHLVAADSLFIVQQVDIIELFINIDEPNFYLIQNSQGQCIYYAYETSEICAQICCRHTRGFQIHIMDMYHNEIIYMNRPCGCSDYFCCYPVMEVYSPPLVPVGAVIKSFHPTNMEFSIVDADENKIFKIEGPCCFRACGCCVEAEFTIHALDEEKTEVGIIRREWGGFVRTLLTNADYYGITFPVDLDVRIKAVFLGALFLIDYTYYESN